VAAALPGAAAEIEDKLVIITSFPNDLTEPFKAAFQKKHPGTAVEVLNKKTTAGVKFIEETSKNNTSDIFWASAPDAFEVLKNDGLLEAYRPDVKGIPDKIGAYPMNDPDGMYLGFAAAGYGIMYNTRYLKAKGLPEPKEWDDLKQAVYHDHVGMSAPSRSGTTHLTVETILQGEGWDKGWRSLKEMAGNFKTITERSFGVPDGVNSGDFGVGIVIDFFGFSSKATGFPVEFVYPTVTTLVPANVAIVKNAPHPNAAKAFVDFLLSTQGQEILLDPKIRRLPINPDTYAKAPADFPNPFKDSSIGAAVRFNVEKSGQRYNLVNALFDQLVTFQLDGLRAATKAVQDAEAALAKKPNAEGEKLVGEARDLIAAMPVSEAESMDSSFDAIFEKKRKKKGDEVPMRQAQVEEKWDAFASKNYAEAEAKAKAALAMAK
jgi:ABC-type Fe3+ transport system substrate-binding protein